MMGILIFKLVNLEVPQGFPTSAYVVGGLLTGFGLMQLPIFMIYAIIKAKGDTLWMVNLKNFTSEFPLILSIHRKSPLLSNQSTAGDLNCQETIRNISLS